MTRNFEITGQRGEALVAEYLAKLKQQNEIRSFKWMNQSTETGMPYDFEIQQNTGALIYSDVKTTSYTFNQKMIFSGSELKFIQQNSSYEIFRVYDLNTAMPHLKVCNNINSLSIPLVRDIRTFEMALQTNNVSMDSVKIAVVPTIPILTFGDEINLVA